MRGLVNAKYVACYDRIPPIDFYKTVFDLGHKLVLPPDIAKKILWIIKMKRDSCEKDIEESIPEFDSFIEAYLNDDSDVPKRKVQRFDGVLNDYVSKLLLSQSIPEETLLRPKILNESGGDTPLSDEYLEIISKLDIAKIESYVRQEKFWMVYRDVIFATKNYKSMPDIVYGGGNDGC
jgi:hypothetical protein